MVGCGHLASRFVLSPNHQQYILHQLLLLMSLLLLHSAPASTPPDLFFPDDAQSQPQFDLLLKHLTVPFGITSHFSPYYCSTSGILGFSQEFLQPILLLLLQDLNYQLHFTSSALLLLKLRSSKKTTSADKSTHIHFATTFSTLMDATSQRKALLSFTYIPTSLCGLHWGCSGVEIHCVNAWGRDLCLVSTFLLYTLSGIAACCHQNHTRGIIAEWFWLNSWCLLL